MITMHLWFNPLWSIEQVEAVKEIVQRMGWCMDDVPDGTGGYPVNLPIEEAHMFFIVQDGINTQEGETE